MALFSTCQTAEQKNDRSKKANAIYAEFSSDPNWNGNNVIPERLEWDRLISLFGIPICSAEPPPSDTQPPPIDTQPPPIDTQPPPIDTQPPPIDTQPPPIDEEAELNDQPVGGSSGGVDYGYVNYGKLPQPDPKPSIPKKAGITNQQIMIGAGVVIFGFWIYRSQ